MPKKRSKKTTGTDAESHDIIRYNLIVSIVVVALLSVALAVVVPLISAQASGAATGSECAICAPRNCLSSM